MPNKIGVCRNLIATGEICGTKLKHHKKDTHDYWYCPKCAKKTDVLLPPNLDQTEEWFSRRYPLMFPR